MIRTSDDDFNPFDDESLLDDWDNPATPNHLETALRYARAGMAIFPLQPGTKRPFPGSAGYLDATIDQVQIMAWWSEHPDANIGFVPATAGLVDFDLDPGYNPDDAAGLDTPLRVKTPRGEHRYFKSDQKFGNGRLAPRIDVRSSAGYAVLPPSVIDQRHDPDKRTWGAYEWGSAEAEKAEAAPLPEHIAARLHQVQEAEVRRRAETLETVGTPENIARAREMLSKMDFNERGYNIACKLCRDLALPVDVAIELFSEWNEQQAEITGYPWSQAHIKQVCANGAHYGHNEGTFAHVVCDYPAPPKSLAEIKERERKQEVRQRVRLMSYSEVMARPAPKMVIEDLVPERKLIMPWSGTGQGKTYYGVELMAAIAMRRPAFGHFRTLLPPGDGVVVMFLGEDHDEAIQGRLTAIAQHYNWNPQGRVFSTDLALPLDDPETLQECWNEIDRVRRETGKPIDAIFDDTLARTIGSLPPNDGETGHRFSMHMEALIREFGCPVIVNAHEPKSGGTVSGTQRFLDYCPVTPHIIGHKTPDLQLTGFTVKMEPKYRIGPTPKPFSVAATTVRLPQVVNGAHTDLIFTLDRTQRQKGVYADLRSQVVPFLIENHPRRVDIDSMAEMLVKDCEDHERAKLIANMKSHLKKHVCGVKGQISPALADLVWKHGGAIVEPIEFQMPEGWQPE
jgi:hypothetical protein